MPRRSRLVFAGVPYHVTQRGSHRQDVFFRDSDRTTYLDWLGEYCRRYAVKVLAYCLMSNHVHLVVVPSTADGLAKVFRPLHSRYAARVNKLKNWTGHLWQARYFSAALDEAYLHAATRYVERNPVRAGMVARAEDHRWSSAAAHCGELENPLLEDAREWFLDVRPGPGWSDWLLVQDDQAQIDAIRKNSEQGFPCGSEEFVRGLETCSGQVLRARPRGRQAGQKPSVPLSLNLA